MSIEATSDEGVLRLYEDIRIQAAAGTISSVTPRNSVPTSSPGRSIVGGCVPIGSSGRNENFGFAFFVGFRSTQN